MCMCCYVCAFIMIVLYIILVNSVSAVKCLWAKTFHRKENRRENYDQKIINMEHGTWSIIKRTFPLFCHACKIATKEELNWRNRVYAWGITQSQLIDIVLAFVYLPLSKCAYLRIVNSSGQPKSKQNKSTKIYIHIHKARIRKAKKRKKQQLLAEDLLENGKVHGQDT